MQKFFLIVAMVILPFVAKAQGLGGHCGAEVDWTLNMDGELSITGVGNMTEYKQYIFVPWTINRSSVVNVEVGEGVTSISQNAFYGCTALEKISFPNGITKIGVQSFYGCTALKEVVLPESVTKIGKNAFYGCTALTKVVIPSSVSKIDKSAFYGCTGLTTIDCYSDSPLSVDTSAFFGVPDNCKLIVNPGTKKQWKAAMPWSRFKIEERK